MAFSRGEVFTQAGRRRLSSQATELFDQTFSGLNSQSSGRKLYANDKGLIETNGGFYFLVDYIFQEKIAADNPYDYTTERQGRVYELTLDAGTNTYNASIIYNDQWKIKWAPNGRGGSDPTGLDDYGRTLSKGPDGQSYIHTSNGNLIYIKNNGTLLQTEIIKMLNKYNLNTSMGDITGIISSPQHGHILGFSTYSGGTDGVVNWPEFNIITEKGGSSAGGMRHVFSKSQRSYPSDIINTQQGDIYATYEGFVVPDGWNVMANDAYERVINPQRLTKISRHGNSVTIDLPGVNKQLVKIGDPYTSYGYELVQGKDHEVWVVETKYTGSAGAPTSINISGRAWKADDLLQNNSAKAIYYYSDVFAPGDGNEPNKIKGFTSIGASSVLIQASSDLEDPVQSMYQSITTFVDNILAGAGKTKESLSLNMTYDLGPVLLTLFGSTQSGGYQTNITDSSLTINASSWTGSIKVNFAAKAAAQGERLDAKQIDFGSSSPTGSLLQGGDGNDQLWGKAGWDVFDGGKGNDLIRAGNGRDIITGGLGADELHGDFGWNTFKSEKDGYSDLIAIKSDQFLSNWIYGKAGNNPNGEKADIIEGLDANDQIKIIGVFSPDISVRAGASAHGVSGIGIYAGGALEALYTGTNLSVAQITAMTSGDGSAAAMANQVSSYGWTGI